MIHSPTRRRVAAAALLALCAGVTATVAHAQAFPTQPIKIVVPYPPGGTNDLVARLLAQKLQEQVGQTVMVENKPGVSGNTGADAVAKSPADGHTLILVTTGHSIAPSLYPKLPYNIATDLVPVAELTAGPMLVLTNPNGPLKTMGDLIAAAKAKPGHLNYGSAGNGSTTHLSSELIATTAGVKFNHIPYKSSAQSVIDLISGRLDMQFATIPPTLTNINAGQVRALATTGTQRVAALPDLPTMIEAGVLNYEASLWIAMVAPAGTPANIVARLNREVNEVLNLPQVKANMTAQALDIDPGPPEALTARIRNDIEKWRKVIAQGNIKAE